MSMLLKSIEWFKNWFPGAFVTTVGYTVAFCLANPVSAALIVLGGVIWFLYDCWQQLGVNLFQFSLGDRTEIPEGW